ncbi:MAG: hypothetical protein ACM3OH_03990 [Bacillota bacterium]|jgi:hypothetical protein
MSFPGPVRFAVVLALMLPAGPVAANGQSLATLPLSALQDSLAALDEAVYRAPHAAASWQALAMVKLELSRRGATVKASMHQSDGESWRHGALVALGRSLAADSTWKPAAAALADLLVATGQDELEPAVQRAARAAASANAGPDAWLAIARMHRGLGHSDSAVASLRRYVQAGGDTGVAALETARALEAFGLRDSAVATYEYGAVRAGPAGRLLYRADVGWVATPAELAGFDSTTPATLGPWIRDFWRRRDVTALRPEGERLAEHLRRWNYVHEHFRIVGRTEGAQFSDNPGGTGAGEDPALAGDDPVSGDNLGAMGTISPDAMSLIEGGRRVLDDRGIVYMRHGEPDKRASWGGGSAALNVHGCVVANESWLYALPTGSLLLHFCSSRRLGSTAATTLVAMLPLYHDLIEARGALDGRYQRLANSLQDIATRQQMNSFNSRSGGAIPPLDLTGIINPNLIRTMRETGQRQIATALRTDTYVQRYERSLEPVVQLYAVGQPGGSDGRLLVVFAIPGDRLAPETRPGVSGVIYPLSIRTIAVGPTGLDVFHRDTTRYFHVAAPLEAGAYLNGLLEMPMPAGRHDVRVLFTQPGSKAAAAAGRDAMTLGDSSSLAISDLIAGREGGGLVWAHGGDPIPLNPLDVYSPSSTMELYYDVSGMVPGRRYRTSIALSNPFGLAAGDQVQVSFEDRASAATQRVRRSLDLRTLKGGQYRLVLTVEDVESGRKVSRERTVNVMERK